VSIPPPPGPHQQGPAQPGPCAPPGPWGHGHGYGADLAAPAPPVNGLAISSLVLGLLCFLPGVGLVLGVIALGQIRRRGEHGRGMAVAGAALSSAGLALAVLLWSTGAAGALWEGVKDAASGGAYDMRRGECFVSRDGVLTGDPYAVDKVPCREPHHGEVFAVVDLPDGEWPGDTAVRESADERCGARSASYAMDAWAVPENVDVYYLVPGEDSWFLGDRRVVCLFGDVDEHRTLTGSLRNDASMLDADQRVLLGAFNAVDAVMGKAPEEYPEEDLEANRAWAGEVARVLGERIGGLRAHDWPARAEKPLARLVDELEKGRGAWLAASRAKDAVAYWSYEEEGIEVLDGPATVTAREALGLAVDPPVVDEGDGPAPGRGGTREREV
jgi:hypothetical protein